MNASSVLAWLSAAMFSSCAGAPSRTVAKPDILLIVADDQGYADLGCAGLATDVDTPNYANNSPLRGSKYTLYEGGIRVPLIVSWPTRFEQAVVRDNVVSALDVLPTLCGIAGGTSWKWAMPLASVDALACRPL